MDQNNNNNNNSQPKSNKIYSHRDAGIEQLRKFENLYLQKTIENEVLIHMQPKLIAEAEAHKLRENLTEMDYGYRDLIVEYEELQDLMKIYKNENKKIKDELEKWKDESRKLNNCVETQTTIRSDNLTASLINSPYNDHRVITETGPKNGNGITWSNQDISYETVSNETINNTTLSNAETRVDNTPIANQETTLSNSAVVVENSAEIEEEENVIANIQFKRLANGEVKFLIKHHNLERTKIPYLKIQKYLSDPKNIQNLIKLSEQNLL